MVKSFNIVEADVSNYQQPLKVTGGKIDIASYLIYSIEGATKGWKKFAQKTNLFCGSSNTAYVYLL